METYKSKLIWAVLLWAAISFSSIGWAESPDDLVIIVNKQSKIKSVSIEELKQIFMKKKTTWRGERIITINAADSSPLRAFFREKVIGMSATAENTYWEKQKVRSSLTPPAEMRSIVKAVFKLPNAISYAYRKDVPPNVVKVVLVIPNSPSSN